MRFNHPQEPGWTITRPTPSQGCDHPFPPASFCFCRSGDTHSGAWSGKIFLSSLFLVEWDQQSKGRHGKIQGNYKPECYQPLRILHYIIFQYFSNFLRAVKTFTLHRGGLGGPVSCKVPSFPDLAQPGYDYLNSNIKKIEIRLGKAKAHAPIYCEEGLGKVPSAPDLAEGGGLPGPILGKVNSSTATKQFLIFFDL